MGEIVKRCKIHGDLTIDQIRKDGLKFRCKQCRLETNAKYREKNREALVEKNMIYKAQNRDIVNAWNKQDRKENPEKYQKYEANYIAKHGREKMRKMEVARIHKLTIDEYDAMFIRQNHLCLICNKEETRVGRTGEIMPLCVDHCHTCEDNGNYAIRGLLCHNCNKGLGNFLDDIDLLQKAIEYLKQHKHLEGD